MNLNVLKTIPINNLAKDYKVQKILIITIYNNVLGKNVVVKIIKENKNK